MFFAGRAGEVLGGYFGRRLAVVALVLLLFLLGVVTGAVSVRTMEQSQVDEVAAYLETFFQGFQSQGIQRSVVFRDSVLATTKTLFVILLAGLSAYGIIAIPLVVFFRGFVVGFTVGFLVYEMAVRGLFFALVAVLPQNLLLIPAILMAGVVCFAFGLTQWRTRFWDPDAPYSFWGTLILTICAWFVALVGSAVEAYLTPLLVGLFSGKLF
ncbi:MAG TPA: stage II sporulation protein M [Bacillota bacterium]|nr:stage II sporulation protein M [Bacillota bacterium]